MDMYCGFLLCAIAFICLFLAKLLHRNKRHVNGKPLPGPKSLPIIGNLLDVDLKRLHLSVFEMVNKFGPIFQIKLLGKTLVLINDVDLEKKAFGSSKYGDDFNDRPDSFAGKYLLFNYNDIAFGRANKKTTMMRKMFHRSLKFYGHGIKHFEETAEDELQRFVDDLNGTNQCDFDMDEVIKKTIANTIVTLMTGRPADASDAEEIWQFIDYTGYFLTGMRLVYGFLPIIRFFPGPPGNVYRKSTLLRNKILERYYFSIRDRTGEDKEVGLVKSLLKLQAEINEQGEIISENDMKGIVLDLIFGAVDTTSSTLTNTFALMLTHSHVAKKIQNEVERVVGSARMPRFSDKENLPYTMATVYEILRYTSAAGPLPLPHCAMKDQNFEGYFIEKNSIIQANHWFIHHDPKLWEEPWDFKPERFLDDEGKLLPLEHENLRNFVAFSTGRRSCPGENFGKSRVFLYLATILQSFDMKPASDGHLPDTDPRTYIPTIDMRVQKHLCRVVLRPRH